MAQVKFITSFPLTFKGLYDEFKRKNIGFVGIELESTTIWLPIKYEQGDQIRKIDFVEIIPEVMPVLFSLNDAVLNFMNEVVAYIMKKRGELKNLTSINHSLCAQCGGKCCKNTGCYFSTSDFEEISFESLYNLLSKGYTSLVPVDSALTGMKDSLLLKVRNVNDPVVVTELLPTSRCILLGDNGCALTDAKRPYGGLALIPMGNACISGYTVWEAVEDWEPYQDLLMKLAGIFRLKDVPFNGVI